MKARILGSPHGLVLHRRVIGVTPEGIALAHAVGGGAFLFDDDGRPLRVALAFVARIHPDDVLAIWKWQEETERGRRTG